MIRSAFLILILAVCNNEASFSKTFEKFVTLLVVVCLFSGVLFVHPTCFSLPPSHIFINVT